MVWWYAKDPMIKDFTNASSDYFPAPPWCVLVRRWWKDCRRTGHIRDYILEPFCYQLSGSFLPLEICSLPLQQRHMHHSNAICRLESVAQGAKVAELWHAICATYSRKLADKSGSAHSSLSLCTFGPLFRASAQLRLIWEQKRDGCDFDSVWRGWAYCHLCCNQRTIWGRLRECPEC